MANLLNKHEITALMTLALSQDYSIRLGDQQQFKFVYQLGRSLFKPDFCDFA
jgi:hypothetical protein